ALRLKPWPPWPIHGKRDRLPPLQGPRHGQQRVLTATRAGTAKQTISQPLRYLRDELAIKMLADQYSKTSVACEPGDGQNAAVPEYINRRPGRVREGALGHTPGQFPPPAAPQAPDHGRSQPSCR